MAPSVFLTGVTGYIGGDFLYALNEAHPDWDMTAMVRNSDKGAKVAQQYPNVKLVYGDLESADLLEEEASKADVVFQFADADHVAGTSALIKGMQRSSKPQVYYIHTSGTGILTFETLDNNAFGDELPRVFNDWDGITELWALPDRALHRNVDKLVQNSWSGKIKSAIVCPPTIYGPGRGPDNQVSMQAPRAANSMLKHQKPWVVGKGANVWHQVHVQDLSDLYLRLTDAAVNGGAPATWNEQGYYFAENGEFVWGDILRAIAKDAHGKGLLPSADNVSLSGDEVHEYLPYGQHMVGVNSRAISKRAKELLGWSPQRPSLMEEVSGVVDTEARTLGLTQGHAAKVAA